MEHFISSDHRLWTLQRRKDLGFEWKVCVHFALFGTSPISRYMISVRPVRSARAQKTNPVSYINRFYGSNRHSKLDDFISDITFFNGKCYACKFCGDDMNCPSNFSELTTKVGSYTYSVRLIGDWSFTDHRMTFKCLGGTWTLDVCVCMQWSLACRIRSDWQRENIPFDRQIYYIKWSLCCGCLKSWNWAGSFRTGIDSFKFKWLVCCLRSAYLRFEINKN